tara:strand:+ start:1657 stop:2130 length:474 start_codon:yes stop_codon:yes gene_type:complete
MILTIIGTHHQPFTRLLDAVNELDTQSERIIQTGHTPFKSEKCTCIDFLPFEEIRQNMRDAEIVIAHAGTGTVMLALSEGKCPIVAPRYARFNEHVDDHQEDLVKVLADMGSIVPYFPDDNLEEAIEKARNMTASRQKDPDASLVSLLRDYTGLSAV